MNGKTVRDKGPDRLTPQEKRVCLLVIKGYANKEICVELQITERTVETHRANAFRKLNVRNAAELQHDYSDELFAENLNF
ncbi:MAG: helix-turn-helix transcriptional regulator [Alcaligenaceae bacterium]|nr:helix-turn-helix transcriptional regulator [Alcaligenaceae bacterium]